MVQFNEMLEFAKYALSVLLFLECQQLHQNTIVIGEGIELNSVGSAFDIHADHPIVMHSVLKGFGCGRGQ